MYEILDNFINIEDGGLLLFPAVAHTNWCFIGKALLVLLTDHAPNFPMCWKGWRNFSVFGSLCRSLGSFERRTTPCSQATRYIFQLLHGIWHAVLLWDFSEKERFVSSINFAMPLVTIYFSKMCWHARRLHLTEVPEFSVPSGDELNFLFVGQCLRCHAWSLKTSVYSSRDFPLHLTDPGFDTYFLFCLSLSKSGNLRVDLTASNCRSCQTWWMISVKNSAFNFSLDSFTLGVATWRPHFCL